MTKFKLLGLFILTLLLAFTLFFTACELFEKEEPEEEPDYELVAEGTIGSAGGILSADSIVIEVPPAAFSEDHHLEIYASTTDKPFGNYVNSSVYRIEGIPDDFAISIGIRVKYHSALSGDTLAAIGQNMYAPSLDDTTTGYYAPAAVDSSGYLVFEYEATSPGVKNNVVTSIKAILPPVKVFGIKEHIVQRSSNGHFRLVLPVSFQPDAITVAAFFEAVYDTFQNIGFVYNDRTKWPVEVTVKSINAVGEYIGNFSNKNSGFINVNSGDMSNLSEIRVTAAHEFFHLVQHLYNFQFGDDLWLAEAFSVWAEDKVDVGTNYLSTCFPGNEMEPFRGWQIATQDHGYGMSLLIKDLVEVYGESVVLDIFDHIKAGPAPVKPVEAVLNSVTESVGIMWHGLLEAYISGHYFNRQANSAFLNDPGSYTNVFFLRTADDTLVSFTDSYQDLSGKLSIVDLNYTSIDTNASLNFTVNDPTNCGLAVFKFKVGTDSTALLGEVFPGGSGTVNIPGIRELTDTGWSLVVLVSYSRHVSPYTGRSDVSLEIEVVGSSVGPFNRGIIWVGLNHHLVFGDSMIINYHSAGYVDTITNFTSSTEFRGHNYNVPNLNITGNTYNGNSNEITGDGPWRMRKIQSFSVTSDDTLGEILNFSGSWSASLLSFPGCSPSINSISGSSIPFLRSSINGDTLIFKVEGPQTCSHINSLSYQHYNPFWDVYAHTEVDTTWNRYSTSLSSYDCDTASAYIQVMLIAE
ncbi:hypothetical protein JW877_09565 [bacterium]|nr:hypothetical protein [bacterium]